MTTTVRDLSISVRTPVSYQRALTRLREALKRHGFETVCEFPLDRELERTVGLGSQHRTVFVVWSPFEAYQAVLSDRDDGSLVLFQPLRSPGWEFNLYCRDESLGFEPKWRPSRPPIVGAGVGGQDSRSSGGSGHARRAWPIPRGARERSTQILNELRHRSHV